MRRLLFLICCSTCLAQAPTAAYARLDESRYECRVIYWQRGSDFITKTDEWISGECAETVQAVDAANASESSPQVTVGIEIRLKPR